MGTDWCHKLEEHDPLVATSDLVDSSEGMRPIPWDTTQHYMGRDADADVILLIDEPSLVIFADDLGHLSLQ